MPGRAETTAVHLWFVKACVSTIYCFRHDFQLYMLMKIKSRKIFFTDPNFRIQKLCAFFKISLPASTVEPAATGCMPYENNCLLPLLSIFLTNGLCLSASGRSKKLNVGHPPEKSTYDGRFAGQSNKMPYTAKAATSPDVVIGVGNWSKCYPAARRPGLLPGGLLKTDNLGNTMEPGEHRSRAADGFFSESLRFFHAEKMRLSVTQCTMFCAGLPGKRRTDGTIPSAAVGRTPVGSGRHAGARPSAATGGDGEKFALITPEIRTGRRCTRKPHPTVDGYRVNSNPFRDGRHDGCMMKKAFNYIEGTSGGCGFSMGVWSNGSGNASVIGNLYKKTGFLVKMPSTARKLCNGNYRLSRPFCISNHCHSTGEHRTGSLKGREMKERVNRRTGFAHNGIPGAKRSSGETFLLNIIYIYIIMHGDKSSDVVGFSPGYIDSLLFPVLRTNPIKSPQWEVDHDEQ
jgi:hypothetical protein